MNENYESLMTLIKLMFGIWEEGCRWGVDDANERPLLISSKSIGEPNSGAVSRQPCYLLITS